MLDSNLLPPKEKEEFDREIKNRLLIFYSFGPFFVLLVFVFLLLSILFFLETHFAAEQILEEALYSNINIRNYELLEKKIKESNLRIKKILEIQNSLKPITSFLEDFFNSLPAEFILNSASYSNGSFNFRGEAIQRSDVLKLERLLKENVFITDFKFPVENLFNIKEINFSFKLKK